MNRSVNSARLDRIAAAVQQDAPRASREQIKNALLADQPWPYPQIDIDRAEVERMAERVFVRLWAERELG